MRGPEPEGEPARREQPLVRPAAHDDGHALAQQHGALEHPAPKFGEVVLGER